jgi:hypothetical protein
MKIPSKPGGLQLIQSGVAEKSLKTRQIRRQAIAWGWKSSLAALVLAANAMLLIRQDDWMAWLGYQAVPPLPGPAGRPSADDQARYWTYALYDFQRFKDRFGAMGYYAVQPAEARRRLQELWPALAPEVRAELAAYFPPPARRP